MPAAEGRLPGWARAVALAWAYAFGSQAIRMVVHFAESPFRADNTYRLGLAIGLTSAWLVGLLVAAPTAVMRSRIATVGSALLGTVGLVGVSLASHYHAIFNQLPDRALLFFLTDVNAVTGEFSSNLPPPIIARDVIGGLVAATLTYAFLVRAAIPRLGARRFALGSICAVAAGLAVQPALRGQALVGASDPYVYMAVTEPISADDVVADADESAAMDRSARLEAALGWPDLGDTPPGYPLCRPPAPAARAAGSAGRRDVIFVLLEGYAARELVYDHDGVPMTPRLREALQDGLLFSHFYANAAQSSAAFPPIFGGLPADPFGIILQHLPIPRVEAWPELMAAAGYDTAYFHGGDLSFENQRPFLREVGFTEFHEPDYSRPVEGTAWGEFDGVLFGRTQDWVDARRQSGDTSPFMATIATISTHDPYGVPDDAPRLVDRETRFGRFFNAMHYMDASFGEFYRWYRENELERGTILVVTGDHAPRTPYPSDPVETSTGMFEFRFEAPLAIIGLTDEELAAGRALTGRPGAQPDIGATILALTGLPPAPCGVGRNLLDPDPAWPADRSVISHAGHIPYFLYVHRGDDRWLYDFRTRRLTCADVASGDLLTDVSESRADREEVARLIDDYLALTSFIHRTRGYAPLRDQAEAPAAAPDIEVLEPGVIPFATRGAGLYHGVDAARALREGASRLAVVAYVSADGALVATDSATVSGAPGEDFVGRFTLEEVRARAPEASSVVTVADLIDAAPPGTELVVRIPAQPRSYLEMDAGRELQALAPRRPDAVTLALVTDRDSILNGVIGGEGVVAYYQPPAPPDDPAAFADYLDRIGVSGITVPEADRGSPLASACRASGLDVAVLAEPATGPPTIAFGQ